MPGAPLENNLAERALKLFIRQRKNSLFYRTEHSAYIASVLTSLIATCLQAGVKIFLDIPECHITKSGQEPILSVKSQCCRGVGCDASMLMQANFTAGLLLIA